MKSLPVVAITLCALCCPVLSSAQTSEATQAPRTRAEVRADLIQVEKAGYYPAQADNAAYPTDIEAAEAKVAREDVSTPIRDTSYGGTQMSGSSVGGVSHTAGAIADLKHFVHSIHDVPESCVGPYSFCHLYAGS
jgi:hypothetical protein